MADWAGFYKTMTTAPNLIVMVNFHSSELCAWYSVGTVCRSRASISVDLR